MHRISSWAAFGSACIMTLVSAAQSNAQSEDFDALTCVNVSTDRRFASQPSALTLTPEDEQLMEKRGCRVIGGARIARADQLCYPTLAGSQSDGRGVDLSGQAFLCYNVRCQREEMNLGNVRTELSVTDRFGDGTIFVNERPTTRRFCVPAVIDDDGPSPTPRPSATPTPTATPPPGSASRAFVEPSADLLR